MIRSCAGTVLILTYTARASRAKGCLSAPLANGQATQPHRAPVLQPQRPLAALAVFAILLMLGTALFGTASSVTHARPVEGTIPTSSARHGGPARSPLTPLAAHCVYTPLSASAFESELANFPNPVVANYILNGLRYGFRIGFTGPRISLISKNLRSAYSEPQIVSQYLAKECELHHTAGPFPSPPCDPFRTAGIGVVPKKSGGNCLIVHLSAPHGSGVNDGISKEDFSLQYITVDTMVSHIIRMGRGALMLKVDVQHAFRNFPVHPEDWPLLGIEWQGQYFVDKVLPFGLRSSPCYI